MKKKPITEAVAMLVARDLASEDGDNPEYDRALCELIADLFPRPGALTGDRAIEIGRTVAPKSVKKWKSGSF